MTSRYSAAEGFFQLLRGLYFAKPNKKASLKCRALLNQLRVFWQPGPFCKSAPTQKLVIGLTPFDSKGEDPLNGTVPHTTLHTKHCTLHTTHYTLNTAVFAVGTFLVRQKEPQALIKDS